MSDMNDFIIAEMPKRPFAESDGQLGQIPIRLGPGPRQLGWTWINDILPPAATDQSASFNFPTATQVWTVQHNRNTQNFIATLWDDQGNQFFAKTTILDANSFRVNMTTATAGNVRVLFIPM